MQWHEDADTLFSLSSTVCDFNLRPLRCLFGWVVQGYVWATYSDFDLILRFNRLEKKRWYWKNICCIAGWFGTAPGFPLLTHCHSKLDTPLSVTLHNCGDQNSLKQDNSYRTGYTVQCMEICCCFNDLFFCLLVQCKRNCEGQGEFQSRGGCVCTETGHRGPWYADVIAAYMCQHHSNNKVMKWKLESVFVLSLLYRHDWKDTNWGVDPEK